MGAAFGAGPSLDDGDDDGPGGGYRPMTDINITPMVDVMLVLLVIFMVAAPLMVAGVPLELPRTSAVKLGQTQKPMVVTVTTDGRLQVRDEFIARPAIVERLRSVRSAEGDAIVYVRADKSQSYGDVMDVLGKIGEAGYGRVSLLAQAAGPPREAPLAPPPSGSTAPAAPAPPPLSPSQPR
jgi:biopolymer transport protein TolR